MLNALRSLGFDPDHDDHLPQVLEMLSDESSDAYASHELRRVKGQLAPRDAAFITARDLLKALRTPLTDELKTALKLPRFLRTVRAVLASNFRANQDSLFERALRVQVLLDGRGIVFMMVFRPREISMSAATKALYSQPKLRVQPAAKQKPPSKEDFPAMVSSSNSADSANSEVAASSSEASSSWASMATKAKDLPQPKKPPSDWVKLQIAADAFMDKAKAMAKAKAKAKTVEFPGSFSNGSGDSKASYLKHSASASASASKLQANAPVVVDDWEEEFDESIKLDKSASAL